MTNKIQSQTDVIWGLLSSEWS